MVEIKFRIDAKSYKVHAEEQEGDVTTLGKVVFADLMTKLALQVETLAQAILDGEDVVITQDVEDTYVALKDEVA